MATKPSTKPENRGTLARRHGKLRKGEPGRALVPRTSRAGVPNKLSAQAKDNIMEVFQKLGGVKAMTTWAKKNQSIFYSSIYARLIPKDVAVNPGAGLEEMLERLAEKRSPQEQPIVDAEYTEVKDA